MQNPSSVYNMQTSSSVKKGQCPNCKIRYARESRKEALIKCARCYGNVCLACTKMCKEDGGMYRQSCQQRVCIDSCTYCSDHD